MCILQPCWDSIKMIHVALVKYGVSNYSNISCWHALLWYGYNSVLCCFTSLIQYLSVSPIIHSFVNMEASWYFHCDLLTKILMMLYSEFDLHIWSLNFDIPYWYELHFSRYIRLCFCDPAYILIYVLNLIEYNIYYGSP